MEQKLIDMMSGHAKHRPSTKYIALCGDRVVGAFDSPDAAFRHIGEVWCRETSEGTPETTMVFTVHRTEAH